jgi:alpha-mannosidase
VFGYPAGLPQVFAAGGMHRFVTQKLSWNKQNTFPHSTFWWEGLDGSRVLTHFPPVDTYNAEITPEEFDFSIANFKDHAWSADSLMPFGHGDGGGGPTREMLERARRLARIDARATLEVGTPDTMFGRIEHGRDALIPVWRGELYFETHRGTLTSQIETKLGNRRCERLLVEAELWSATLGRSADLDALWKRVLTQQFHDILPGSSIAWVHDDAEAEFAEVGAELESRIAALLADVAGPGRWIANPADTPIDEVVVLPAGAFTHSSTHSSTQSSPDSTDGHHQLLSDGRIAVRVSVPALGIAPLEFRPVDDRVVLSDSSMTNGHLAVRWDPFGNVTSIIDLAHARELVPIGDVAAALELAVDHPVEYDAWDLESWTRSGGVALTGPATSDGDSVDVSIVDDGPLVGRVRVARTFGPSRSVVTYELRADSPQLFVHVELDWHHDEHLLSMAFPLDVRSDVATCDIQFGVVTRPTHPSSPWDAAKFEVCAHRFVDVAEPDFGVAILNAGRYGHGLFDGAVRVSLAKAAKYPDPDADRGHHELTLAIRPHGPGLADVRDAAARLNAPLRLVVDGRATSPIPSVVRLTGLDGERAPGVEIDAVKLADDGSGDLIVRLHEAVGNRTRLAVLTPGRISDAWRCTLLEEPHTAEEVGDGIVTLTLRPFQIVTLRLRRTDLDDGRTR